MNTRKTKQGRKPWVDDNLLEKIKKRLNHKYKCNPNAINKAGLETTHIYLRNLLHRAKR